MSAKDRFHDTVVRALQKDGWTIIKEQVRIIVENRRLWIDLKASNETQFQIILVEIKGFESPASNVAYLEQLLGQYLLYRAIMQDIGWQEELYLAIPNSAYEGIFSEGLGILARRAYGIKTIVIDAESEKILKWIP